MGQQDGLTGGLVLGIVGLLMVAPWGVGVGGMLAAGSADSDLIGGGSVAETPQQAGNEPSGGDDRPSSAGLAGDLVGAIDRLPDQLAIAPGAGTTRLEQGDRAIGVSSSGRSNTVLHDRHAPGAAGTSLARDDGAAPRFETLAADQAAFTRAIVVDHEIRRSDDGQTLILADHPTWRENRVIRRGEPLAEADARLEEGTNADVAPPRRTVATNDSNVTKRPSAVRGALLEPTRIDVVESEQSRRISFVQPLVLRGRLVNESGAGITNRSIVLRAGEEHRVVETGSNGSFTLRYRPVMLPLSTESVTVAYEPENRSRYAASSAAAPVKVVQVRPTIEIDLGPDTAGYLDILVVAGSVTANGTAVPGVPVVLSVEGEPLEETWAGPGRFRTTMRFPGTVPPGERTIVAQIPLEGRAIGSASETWPVTVERSQTTIRLHASDTGRGEVELRGRLFTTEGRVISEETIAIRMNGASVGTARTTQAGSFATTFSVPPDQLELGTETPIEVVATFDGSGTNLGSTEARTRLLVAGPRDDAATVSQPDQGLAFVGEVAAWFRELSQWEQVALILGTAIAAAAAVVFRRGVRRLLTEGTVDLDLGRLRSRFSWTRFDRTGGKWGAGVTDGSGMGNRGIESDQSADGQAAVSAREAIPASQLLARAERERAAGDETAAFVTAFLAIRRALGRRLDLPDSRTHWEFLAACSEAGLDPDSLDDLRWMTAIYEQTTYARREPTVEDAARALSVARRLTGRDGPGEDGP